MDFCYRLKCTFVKYATTTSYRKRYFQIMWSRTHIGLHFLVIFGDFSSDRELFPLQSLCLKSGDKDK